MALTSTTGAHSHHLPAYVASRPRLSVGLVSVANSSSGLLRRGAGQGWGLLAPYYPRPPALSRGVYAASFLSALSAYADTEGNLLVPQGFVVADDDVRFPASCRGLPLGRLVATERRRHRGGKVAAEDVATLTGVGFVWNVKDWMWEEQWVPALDDYYVEHGHLRVPPSYVVEPTARRKARRPARRSLGRVRRDSMAETGAETEAETVAAETVAAEVAAETEKRWGDTPGTPVQTRGGKPGKKRLRTRGGKQGKKLRLGQLVNNIRSQETHVKGRPERVAWLNARGFVWDVGEWQWEGRWMPALHSYYEENRHLRVRRYRC